MVDGWEGIWLALRGPMNHHSQQASPTRDEWCGGRADGSERDTRRGQASAFVVLCWTPLARRGQAGQWETGPRRRVALRAPRAAAHMHKRSAKLLATGHKRRIGDVRRASFVEIEEKKNEEKEKAGQRVVDGRNWGGAAGLAWSWFPGCEREREGGREGNGRNTDSRKCPGRVQVGWWMMSLVGRAWVHRADLCRLGLCFAGLVGAWGLSLLSQSHSPQQSRHRICQLPR